MDRRSEAKTRRPAKAVAASDDALCTLLSAGLRVQAGEDRWRVIGNTLSYRLLLREAGGTWNRLDQCWEFSGDDPTDRLASALEARPAGAGHNAAPAEPQPHYHGHRGRVRERVMRAGAELLEDYELLELLLFYSIERIDTKPLAKRLLDRFGTLGDVFAAESAQLREFDIDQRTLVLFKASREAGRRLAERKVKDMPVLTNWQQLIDYCHAALAHEKTEQFRILFLDRKNVLIADEVQQRGTIDHTPVYPREVVKRALTLNAAALILVHNHPSGDPKPSRDDIEMTRESQGRGRGAGHRDPRPPGDRPQGPRELQESWVALVVESPGRPTSPEAERRLRPRQAMPQVRRGRRVARTSLRHPRRQASVPTPRC